LVDWPETALLKKGTEEEVDIASSVCKHAEATSGGKLIISFAMERG
jgi:hypothetical protein